jgi:hypothetical protein
MLKFILKKKSDGSQLEIASFAEMFQGDEWVARITGPGTYGRNEDVSVLESDLVARGLAPEQATTSEVSDEPKLDDEGAPIMDSQEPPQPVMQMLYHFAKEWEVEVVDITAELEQAGKVQDRSESRQKCLAVIDFIAAYNKDSATPEQMSAIFSNPAFVGIVLALLTGGPRTAEALVSQHGPSLYPQPMVDKVLAMLGAIE